MIFSSGEIEGIPVNLVRTFTDMENRVMSRIVETLKENGSDITRAVDWQLHRLNELGKTDREIKAEIQKALNLSDEEIDRVYSDVLKESYTRDKTLYDDMGQVFIPYEDNEELKQLVSAVTKQTKDECKNITQSLGFAKKQPDGKITYTPLGDFYRDKLDSGLMEIATGITDYNTVLNRLVSEMTNSGMRWVDYESGWSNRVDVACRRALLTGYNQVVGKVNEDNAEKLGTEYFEVSYHSGARPTHQVWQGRVYSKSQLKTVCGLGTVTGLCGANCYHSYSSFFPGISVRTYTDEELDRMNAEDNTPREYNGKQYTKYEALQRQRKLETTMRAERQKINLLIQGGADEDDILSAKVRYNGTSDEYVKFSRAMELPQQRQRVTVDGLMNIGGDTSFNDYNQFQKYSNVLGKNAPKTLEEFTDIKYNDNNKWNELKYQYRTINRYDIVGDVSVDEILALDKVAYYNKRTSFDISDLHGENRHIVNRMRTGGNSASMNFDGVTYYSHSRVGSENTLEYNSYIGKEPLIGLSEQRKFTVKDLGDGIPREYDTESKFLEFVAKQKKTTDKFTVTILSEKHICESCQGVVEQFRKMFPNAIVNVVSGKENYNGSVKGLKTWLYRKKVN